MLNTSDDVSDGDDAMTAGLCRSAGGARNDCEHGNVGAVIRNPFGNAGMPLRFTSTELYDKPLTYKR